jgi:hypothetical protein
MKLMDARDEITHYTRSLGVALTKPTPSGQYNLSAGFPLPFPSRNKTSQPMQRRRGTVIA